MSSSALSVSLEQVADAIRADRLADVSLEATIVEYGQMQADTITEEKSEDEEEDDDEDEEEEEASEASGEDEDEDYTLLNQEQLIERLFDMKANVQQAAQFGQAMMVELQQVTELRAEKAGLEEDKAALASQVEDTEWRLRELEESVRMLGATVGEKDAEIERLRSELGQMQEANSLMSQASEELATPATSRPGPEVACSSSRAVDAAATAAANAESEAELEHALEVCTLVRLRTPGRHPAAGVLFAFCSSSAL
eukprot:SAG11_NODE_2114_length_3798_cov_9.451473_4_plen_254_part_00